MTHFDSRADEILRRLDDAVPFALNRAGTAAVHAVRMQMETGYGNPIRDTGALINSITHTVEGNTLYIGSPLPYADIVHDGTVRMPGRPFLQDSLSQHMEELHTILAAALADAMA